MNKFIILFVLVWHLLGLPVYSTSNLFTYHFLRDNDYLMILPSPLIEFRAQVLFAEGDGDGSDGDGDDDESDSGDMDSADSRDAGDFSGDEPAFEDNDATFEDGSESDADSLDDGEIPDLSSDERFPGDEQGPEEDNEAIFRQGDDESNQAVVEDDDEADNDREDQGRQSDDDREESSRQDDDDREDDGRENEGRQDDDDREDEDERGDNEGEDDEDSDDAGDDDDEDDDSSDEGDDDEGDDDEGDDGSDDGDDNDVASNQNTARQAASRGSALLDQMERSSIADRDDQLDDEELAELRLDDLSTDEDGASYIRGEALILIGSEEYKLFKERTEYQINNEVSVNSLNQTLARIEISDRQFTEASQFIKAIAPNALVDFNHTYDLSAANTKMVNRQAARLKSREPLSSHDVFKVGMIDSGVDRFHPSLRNSDIIIKYFSSSDTKTPFNHGTAVASVLVGSDRQHPGLLPSATLFAASVFGTSAKGFVRSTTEDLVAAVDWLVSSSIPVISMSFAGPKNILLENIIANASKQGFTFVAAVGNAGPNSPPLYPAAYPDVIAVTAVDERLKIYRRAVTGNHVEFAAPGVRVVAANDRNYAYKNFSGSSFAAPYVAALLALEINQVSNSIKDDALKFYRNNALDLGTEGKDRVYGFGLIRGKNY